MKQTFKILNVKCGGCASTLKTKLSDKFGEIEVDLSKNPREITLDILDENIEEFKKQLKDLGYPLTTEKLSFIDKNTTKAKSFVSCAIGKINS